MTSPAATDPRAARGTSGESMARMARGSTASLIGAAVTAVCTFAVAVSVTRGFSRAEAGVFFSATSLFLVATSVGQLGTQTSLVYFLSRARMSAQSKSLDAYLRIALRPVVAVALVMAVAMFAFARPLAEATSADHVDTATTYLRLLAFFVPLVALEMATLGATRGLGSMRTYTLVEQIGRPLVQLTFVVAAAFAASTTVLGIAWALPYLAAAVLAALSWRRLRSAMTEREPRAVAADATDADEATAVADPAPAPTVDEPSYRQFWSFSLPRALTSVVQMLLQRLDIVLVGAMSGAVDAAIYAAATRFIVVGQLGTNSLTLATQPQLAEKLAAGDRRATNEVYQTSTAWLILVTWPVYLTLILFAGPLLSLFGGGYTTGTKTILIIALSMLVSTGLGMVDTVLAMAGHTSWNLGNAFLALVINIGLDVWLIPDHGIVGAAIGWAVAIIVRNVAAATQVGIALGFHPLARCTVTAVAVCTVSYLGVLGIARLVFDATVLGLVVGLVVATLCFAIVVWTQRRSLRLDALAGLRKRRAGGVHRVVS